MRRSATFNWPASVGAGSVEIRELTTEELTRILAAFTDPAKGSIELVKAALVSVDGVPVTPENRDQIWASLNAKQRALVQDGYRFLNIPSDEERTSFFDSVIVRCQD